MKIQYLSAIWLLLIVVCYLDADICLAVTATPFISEVYPAPVTGEKEWVEITNPTDQIATISGWLLYDQISSPSVIYSIGFAEILPWAAVAFDLTTEKLNNSGDVVVLFNEFGVELDRFAYNSTTQGKSWQRVDKLSASFLDFPTKNQAVIAPKNTPSPSPITVTNSPTITPLPTTAPSEDLYPEAIRSITITEIMACPPSGQQEWVELYNSSPIPLSIEGWYITDFQDSRVYLDGEIAAQSFRVSYWQKSLLNNQGDSISLFTNSNEKVMTIDIPQCKSGQSFAAINGVFEYTDSPSPGQFNQAPTLLVSNPTISPPAISNPSSSPDNKSSTTPTNINTKTSSTNRFIPPIPTISLDAVQLTYQSISNPIQLIQTSKPNLIIWSSVIISLLSLLVAYKYFHAFN